MDAGALLAPVLTVGGLGFAFGALIALAGKRFRVFEDPRIEGVLGFLPGSNCGACGFAGCRAFAEGLVEKKAQPAKCTQIAPDRVGEVASYLGVEAGTAVKRVARVLCAGGCDVAPQRAEYRGLATCRAAAAVAGGGKACAWGCLGYGDCEAACDYGAIAMNAQRLPVVAPEKCVACNDCVVACPKDLFTLMPVEWKLIVQCRSALEGEAAEAVCRVACNACGRCAQDAAPGLIAMRGGLAVIDYGRNALAAPAAAARCPTGAIAWVEGAQFEGNGR
jgi:Na+-translocating ferredoxin:NAD+ oxidoreductase RNF subunit RnfB